MTLLNVSAAAVGTAATVVMAVVAVLAVLGCLAGSALLLRSRYVPRHRRGSVDDQPTAPIGPEDDPAFIAALAERLRRQ